MNAGLTETLEQQKGWLVNNAGLRKSLCEATLQGFVVPYRKFWDEHQVQKDFQRPLQIYMIVFWQGMGFFVPE